MTIASSLSPEGLTGFIFDFDGVLVDSNPLHIEAWRRALEQHGHHVDPTAIFPEIGKGGDKLVVSLLGQDIEDRQGDALRAAHGREYASLVGARGLRPFECGPDLIAELRARGVATALATSSQSDELELAERTSGVAWRGLFDVVVLAEDVDETKPAPDLVAAATRELKLAAADCAMLGDTPWDAKAARRAGVSPLGVTSGGHAESTLRAAGAAAIYRDVADVSRHVGQVLARHWGTA
jgi:phosphoglycolate phosphatase-like HAD superfamily hydrolase